MAEKVTACCHVCRGYHPATELTGDAFEAAKEDAQSGADYFLMDDHNDSTGQKCKGSGQTPEYLATDEDDGNYLEPGDIDEDYGDTTGGGSSTFPDAGSHWDDPSNY